MSDIPNKTIEYKQVDLEVCYFDGDFKSIFSHLQDCKKKIPEEFLDEAWIEIDENGGYNVSYSRPATPDELIEIKADYEAEAAASEANASRIRIYAASL